MSSDEDSVVTGVDEDFEYKGMEGTRQSGPYKHGLNVPRGEYYKSLPERDKNLIDIIAEDLLEKSYYSESDTAMVEKCRQIAVDMHQKRRADGYVAKKGLVQDETVGFHEEYGPIKEKKENVLMITKDRLSREARLSMKDLGILDEDHKDDDEGSSGMMEKIAQIAEDIEDEDD